MATTIRLPCYEMYDKNIEAACFKCEAMLSERIIIVIIARESIGPLPSYSKEDARMKILLLH